MLRSIPTYVVTHPLAALEGLSSYARMPQKFGLSTERASLAPLSALAKPSRTLYRTARSAGISRSLGSDRKSILKSPETKKLLLTARL